MWKQSSLKWIDEVKWMTEMNRYGLTDVGVLCRMDKYSNVVSQFWGKQNICLCFPLITLELLTFRTIAFVLATCIHLTLRKYHNTFFH